MADILPLSVEAFEIVGAPSLDPIRVYLQDYGKEAGRITVECYGQAWAAFFGSTGCPTLRRFLSLCDAEYLSGKLASQDDGLIKQQHRKHCEAYRLRVTAAVLDALKDSP